MIAVVRPSQSRPVAGPSGFTIVELMVVTIIIGMLLAMVIPAVQTARESARRAVCLNNISQIGKAVNGYIAQNNDMLPAGSYYTAVSAQGMKGAGLARLLPWLEEQAAFGVINPVFMSTTTGTAVDDVVFPGTTNRVRDLRIPIFLCPSDDTNQATLDAAAASTGQARPVAAPTNYAASSGPTAHADNSACSCPSASAYNAYALAGYVWGNNAGAFNRNAYTVAVEEIVDGMTTTIFYGETRPACADHHIQGWLRSNSGQGLTSTLVPINTDTCSTDSSASGCVRPCNWNLELGFRSRHAGGANFVFGGGNTAFLTEDVDFQVYQYLGAKADRKGASIP